LERRSGGCGFAIVPPVVVDVEDRNVIGCGEVTGELFISTFGQNLIYQVGNLAWLSPLSADVTVLSASTGGSVPFRIRAGTQNAGRSYLIGASASGTYPGAPAGAVIVPLNFDALTAFVLSQVNTPTFDLFLGVTGAAGEATATLNLPSLTGVSGPVGVDVAGILLAPVDFATNAVNLTILP
jgi:hypothetical protein